VPLDEDNRAAGGERQVLRFLTWNVGRVYSRKGNNRLDDHDIPSVAQTLVELDADCILLQELVDDLQLRALVSRTHGEYAGAMAERCGYDRKCAMLVRKKLDPEFEQHQLAPTERGVVLARFSVNGVRAAALCVHFDVFNQARRRHQAEAVTSITDGRDEDVVLVAGDFNFDPAWAQGVDAPVDRGTWSLLTERFTDAGQGIGPTLMGIVRIDHVLVRGAESEARVIHRRRLPLGDHDPVLCELKATRVAARPILRRAVG
jgi:endonuclease/exonuclease/phosphatase family metal-dependent hydrolase